MQCLLSIFGAASRTRCLCCYLPCACVLESSQVLLVESCSLESVRFVMVVAPLLLIWIYNVMVYFALVHILSASLLQSFIVFSFGIASICFSYVVCS